MTQKRFVYCSCSPGSLLNVSNSWSAKSSQSLLREKSTPPFLATFTLFLSDVLSVTSAQTVPFFVHIDRKLLLIKVRLSFSVFQTFQKFGSFTQLAFSASFAVLRASAVDAQSP